MKRFFTLILALVLAFALTMPAMAFTSDDSADDDSAVYDLSIYLVEYDDDDLFGLISLPESDRGYAKNEIVAAVVELEVPEDEDPMDDGYTELQIRGDSVDFDVTDDPIYNDEAEDLGTLISDGDDGWTLDFSDENGDGSSTDDMTFADDTIYKWLVFAKITDDGASMTAKLISGTAGDEFEDDDDSIAVTLNGNDYTIAKLYDEDDGGTYTITDEDGNQVIIYIDEDYESEGMSIYVADLVDTFDLGVNTDDELGIVDGATIDTSSDDYEDVMDIYEDVVVDDLVWTIS
jgi:hypothetical protein